MKDVRVLIMHACAHTDTGFRSNDLCMHFYSPACSNWSWDSCDPWHEHFEISLQHNIARPAVAHNKPHGGVWSVVKDTQKAVIATLPLTTHPQQLMKPHLWVHVYTCINRINGMAKLTPLAIPTILKLTILIPIPPQGVRLGARTCILAIRF